MLGTEELELTDQMDADSVLTRTDDIYGLLLRIAEAPENRDLKVELKKTADGTKRASIGGGVGGVAGAAAGALLFGPVGAVVGAALERQPVHQRLRTEQTSNLYRSYFAGRLRRTVEEWPKRPEPQRFLSLLS